MTVCSMTVRQHASMLAYEELRDRLIVLNGWSKTYAMTGWRLGYSIWPEKADRPRGEAGCELPFLRQRADAVCRDCCAERAARRSGRHAGRV